VIISAAGVFTPALAEVRAQIKRDEVTDADVVEAVQPYVWAPDIRLTAAVALGRLAIVETADGLRQALTAEQAAVGGLQANMNLPGYRLRQPVVKALHVAHSDVLFYVSQAVRRLKAE